MTAREYREKEDVRKANAYNRMCKTYLSECAKRDKAHQWSMENDQAYRIRYTKIAEKQAVKIAAMGK